jgi:hypothetical protein
MPTRVYVSLGSNIKPERNPRQAVRLLAWCGDQTSNSDRVLEPTERLCLNTALSLTGHPRDCLYTKQPTGCRPGRAMELGMGSAGFALV